MGNGAARAICAMEPARKRSARRWSSALSSRSSPSSRSRLHPASFLASLQEANLFANGINECRDQTPALMLSRITRFIFEVRISLELRLGSVSAIVAPRRFHRCGQRSRRTKHSNVVSSLDLVHRQCMLKRNGGRGERVTCRTDTRRGRRRRSTVRSRLRRMTFDSSSTHALTVFVVVDLIGLFE